VSYDIGRQGTLADRLEQGARSMGIRWFDSLSGLELELASPRGGVVSALWRRHPIGLALGVAIWGARARLVRLLRIRSRVERVRRGQATVADATLLYERMLDLLKRRGYQKPAWVHAHGVRPIAAVGPTGDSRDGVHRPVQRSALWPPHRSGAAPVDASR